MIQYKIITKTAATNIILQKMGIVETDKYMRCSAHRDTIEHKFWECTYVQEFWDKVARWLESLPGGSTVS